jgi:hypothetical protein
LDLVLLFKTWRENSTLNSKDKPFVFSKGMKQMGLEVWLT